MMRTPFNACCLIPSTLTGAILLQFFKRLVQALARTGIPAIVGRLKACQLEGT